VTDAAIIALATSGAGVTIVAVGAVFMATWWMRDAKDAAARCAAQNATLAEQAKASAATISTLTNDLKTANARVEALDAENQKLRAAQPVAGSFDRLLSSAASSTANGSASTGGVSDHKAAIPSGADDLLDPAKA